MFSSFGVLGGLRGLCFQHTQEIFPIFFNCKQIEARDCFRLRVDNYDFIELQHKCTGALRLINNVHYLFSGVLAELTFQYVQGIQWILFYYFCGVPSWSWYDFCSSFNATDIERNYLTVWRSCFKSDILVILIDLTDWLTKVKE